MLVNSPDNALCPVELCWNLVPPSINVPVSTHAFVDGFCSDKITWPVHRLEGVNPLIRSRPVVAVVPPPEVATELIYPDVSIPPESPNCIMKELAEALETPNKVRISLLTPDGIPVMSIALPEVVATAVPSCIPRKVAAVSKLSLPRITVAIMHPPHPST